jgi:hypothetical protein
VHISRFALKLAALLGLALALGLGFGATAGAQEGPGYEGYEGYEGDECPEGYEGYEGYEGCEDDETAAPPAPTPTPTPTPSAGGSSLPDTGGVTMLAAAGVIGAIGLTIRRLATS